MRTLLLKILNIVSTVIILLFFLNSQGWGAYSSEEEKGLKKLCEEDASDLYKKETGKIKLENFNKSYTNHYHKSFQNCFMIIKISPDLNSIEPPSIEILSYEFYDVDESSKIGAFLMQLDRKTRIEKVIYCHVSEEECHSLLEWKKLVKPFMEE